MKLLFIQSGFLGIYPFIDSWIEESIIETGVACHTVSPKIDVADLKEMINKEKPDIVLMIVGNQIPFQFIQTIQQATIPLAVWLTEDPFYVDVSLTVLPFADYILTIDESAVEHYLSLGYQNVYYFPLATNEKIFKPLTMTKEIDLLLVGYPYPNRTQLVDYLANHSDYSITLIGQHWKRYLNKQNLRRKNVTVINKWLSPFDINLYYNKSKIILNPHRTFHFKFNKNKTSIKNRSVNNRFFDIFASGGFQLIDCQINIPVSPPKPSAKITYLNEQKCLELIHEYMQQHVLMQETTKAWHAVTLQHDTFNKRMMTLIHLLKPLY